MARFLRALENQHFEVLLQDYFLEIIKKWKPEKKVTY